MNQDLSLALPRRRIFIFLLSCSIAVFSILPPALAATLKPTRIVTENGITLLMLEQASLPIVSVQVLVRAGSILDPQNLGGLAGMTASLLEEGTQRRSATDISDAIDFIGANFSSSASKDYSTLWLRVLKKDVHTGLDLLSDVLMHPKFEAEEFERTRKQVLGGIRAEQDRPGAIARRQFQSIVFQDHPYAHAVVGDKKSVTQIQRDDLVAFHKKYYRPNNTIIAVVGDLTKAETKQLIQKYFGQWKPQKVVFPKISPPLPFNKKKVSRIEKDLTQATVILGHLGIHRANPDYYATLVMNYILGGGGFSSRMMADIRDERGLVYSIYSRFVANNQPGAFKVSFQTKSSSTQEAIKGILSLIKEIQRKSVSEVELSEAKAYLSGSFPRRIDTTKKVASLLTSIEFHGLGLDYFDEYVKAIRRVSQADVLRVAKKYLNPDHYALIVVGKQSDISIED